MARTFSRPGRAWPAGITTGVVREDPLVFAIQAVGRTDRETAKAAVSDPRERGEIAEDADQHPQAGVFLVEEDEF